MSALRDVLSLEFGLRGTEADHYNPLNTYLPSVLDRKLGIPINLASVAILVGQRLDYDGSWGAETQEPLHVLLWRAGRFPAARFFLDPYNGFRSVSRAQAENMIRAFGKQAEPGMTTPVNERGKSWRARCAT